MDAQIRGQGPRAVGRPYVGIVRGNTGCPGRTISARNRAPERWLRKLGTFGCASGPRAAVQAPVEGFQFRVLLCRELGQKSETEEQEAERLEEDHEV